MGKRIGNINNPKIGIRMEAYGSPEFIDSSIGVTICAILQAKYEYYQDKSYGYEKLSMTDAAYDATEDFLLRELQDYGPKISPGMRILAGWVLYRLVGTPYTGWEDKNTL